MLKRSFAATTLAWILLVVTTGCQTGPRIVDLAIPLHSATTPATRGAQRLVDRHERFNEIAEEGGVDLVFLGDSITQGWERNGREVWEEFYGGRHAANFGIGGDRTQHVLWRIENGNFDGIEPELIVLMIGTNNSRDNTAPEIADGVTAIIQKLRIKLPRTRILMLAIFPRGQNPDNTRRANNEAANEVFMELADGRMIHYLDIGDVFINDDGTISAEIMPDYLHLSPAGYRLWAGAIEDDVARLLGEK